MGLNHLIKLQEVKIAMKNHCMCAIQLEFTDGITSPLFESEQYKVEPVSHKIDPTRKITKIEMKVYNGSYFTKLILRDANDYAVVQTKETYLGQPLSS